MKLEFSEILERMLKAGNLKSGSELARAVGITPQAIFNYRKRGEVPAGLVLKFADIHGVSVDWLLTGEGEMRRDLSARPGGEASTPSLDTLDPDEILYIGKLLKVLRAPVEFAAPAVKVSIDALFKASYEQMEDLED